MSGVRARVLPQVEALETRLALAVSVTTFKSDPALPEPDSIRIRGTAGIDNVTITDTGASVRIFEGQDERNNPIPDPVIVRIDLRSGNDILTYLVPNAALLERTVEVIDGSGRNTTRFDNQAEGGTGIELNDGSNFVLQANGVGGQADLFAVNFGDVKNAIVSLDLAFGANPDKVQVNFHGDIDEDSNVSAQVNLGDASTKANSCKILLGDFATDIGFNDELGSTLDVGIIGGAQRDNVTVTWNYFRVGTVFTAPTMIDVSADLGNGNDKFTFNHEAQSVINDEAKVLVSAHGGGGNDKLVAQQGDDFPGGQIHVRDGGLLDIGLFGDDGDDVLKMLYDEDVNGIDGELNCDADGTINFLLDGGAGRDWVSARLLYSDFFGEATADTSLQLLGGAGNDTLGLDLDDDVGMTYTGGSALVDGGGGADVQDPVLGIVSNPPGLINRVSV